VVKAVGFSILVIPNKDTFERASIEFWIMLIEDQNKCLAPDLMHVGVVWLATVIFLPWGGPWE
jgi:hypothetical protein